MPDTRTHRGLAALHHPPHPSPSSTPHTHTYTQAAVVGVTVRSDVLDLLEKRVRSRFSHRKVDLVAPRGVEARVAAAAEAGGAEAAGGRAAEGGDGALDVLKVMGGGRNGRRCSAGALHAHAVHVMCVGTSRGRPPPRSLSAHPCHARPLHPPRPRPQAMLTLPPQFASTPCEAAYAARFNAAAARALDAPAILPPLRRLIACSQDLGQLANVAREALALSSERPDALPTPAVLLRAFEESAAAERAAVRGGRGCGSGRTSMKSC